MSAPVFFTRARRRTVAVAVALAVVGTLTLVGCAAPDEAATKKVDPVKVEKIPGSDAKQLTLDPTAAKRLGIRTDAVSGPADAGTSPLAVPYGAVLYDSKGTTFVYTNPQPMVFVRHTVTVDRIEGPVAFLRTGPPLGTPVVTVGGAELVGIEFGVGK
jgi:hypothetical protein